MLRPLVADLERGVAELERLEAQLNDKNSVLAALTEAGIAVFDILRDVYHAFRNMAQLTDSCSPSARFSPESSVF